MASNTVFVIVGIITIIILIAFGIWLYYSYKNNTGFFEPFAPTLGPDLQPSSPAGQFVPLTPDAVSKKTTMLNKTITQVNAIIANQNK